VLAQEKGSKTYPEQGKVLAQTVSAKPSAHRVAVFRVEAETKVYEFERTDESKLTVGNTIRFRVEKDFAYVQQGDKEQKFRVIDTQLKDDD
jgi:hypothetical protein